MTTLPAWVALDSASLAGARAALAPLFEDFAARHQPDEANTESDLIEKVLDALGWDNRIKQPKANAKGRLDVPDYLLCLTSAAKASAVALKSAPERFALGATILEAKAFDLPLDRGGAGSSGAPSTQILRYLGTVDVQSNSHIRFGILTNGRLWRLYDHKAKSRLEGYVEIDLAAALGDDHALRLFLCLFARAGFDPGVTGETVLTRALTASRDFEARVTEELANNVFEKVFPDLANALAANDPQRPAAPDRAYYDALREAALTWLYRLLFVLYAEDRDLIPTRQRGDGLYAMRRDVAAALDTGSGLSERRTNHDGDLRAIWNQIDQGDDGIGLPPYNGGLFKPARSSLLDRSLIPDADFAPLLDALSRERTGDQPRFINYRDLSVQHLGSVYERLLEFDLTGDAAGIITRPQTFARKTSGSYYTPEELVMLVIRRTIGPLLEEKRKTFADALADKERSKQDAAYRIGWLHQFDPASAFLTLKICDPAMGSGHFLVSLVDYLADQVMLETEASAAEVDGYRSPLLDRLETIRARIRDQADQHHWSIDEAQLIDRQLVRRIILKRVIHGVDKNPMAVELAKLSLWLHTFTVGAPLSFLDHHLRCGDSLFGEWIGPALTRLERGGLFDDGAFEAARSAAVEMKVVEDLTDADITEVHQSQDAFGSFEDKTAPFLKRLSLLQGYRWIEGAAEGYLKQAKALEKESGRSLDSKRAFELSRQAWDLKRRGRALDVLLDGELGDVGAVIDYCYGRIGQLPDQAKQADIALDPLKQAAHIADVSNFFHWEIAFPNVWGGGRSVGPRDGFDAVIGNPPWDRLKMQEVEWFAARAPAIAYATRASDRKAMVAKLKADGDALSQQYEMASNFAAMAARMANLKPDKGGQFPLLGGGDTNLYSLFVERAQMLVHATGMVGLLTPSGIAGDLGASAFFRSVSVTGRLGALLDFENRGGSGKGYFPDVDSRFKFCALVFGGKDRTFAAAECGFFLGGTADAALAAATFPLTPVDFAAVNPNTGTAPVFRTQRDADLTTAIYARLPVLVKHAPNRAIQDIKPWPVKYLRMFDMTNDSHLFQTRAELGDDGWYPVAGGRMKKGEAQCVPLYEGKMVQAFDHRAANVTVNEKNLKRAAQPEDATLEQHQDPSWLPEPQFFVASDLVTEQVPSEWNIAFKSITAPTNMRTMIAGLLPLSGVGNSMGMILTDAASRPLVYANLNSFALDFVMRQKVQGQNLNWFILEQLPVIPPSAYAQKFGKLTAREIAQREVLHLTYTAHDMAAFARDMGYDGAPFAWDEADRRQRRARLDALYFHLYGIGQDDADYILSTFPIVRRHDERDFGRFLTRDLILAQMAALAAGDSEAQIVLR